MHNAAIVFKSDHNLTEKKKEILQQVLQTQPEVSFLRGFLEKVWAIFNGPTTELEAQLRLLELKQYAQFHEKDGYGKSITFLEENFNNMTTFLRVPGVKRNSLSETGMRVLRRLEQNHDGFRTAQGRRNVVRIYQAVTNFGWSIHNPPKINHKFRLSTGQKFDNPFPHNKIGVIRIGYEAAQYIESQAKHAFCWVTVVL